MHPARPMPVFEDDTLLNQPPSPTTPKRNSGKQWNPYYDALGGAYPQPQPHPQPGRTTRYHQPVHDPSVVVAWSQPSRLLRTDSSSDNNNEDGMRRQQPHTTKPSPPSSAGSNSSTPKNQLSPLQKRELRPAPIPAGYSDEEFDYLSRSLKSSSLHSICSDHTPLNAQLQLNAVPPILKQLQPEAEEKAPQKFLVCFLPAVTTSRYSPAQPQPKLPTAGQGVVVLHESRLPQVCDIRPAVENELTRPRGTGIEGGSQDLVKLFLGQVPTGRYKETLRILSYLTNVTLLAPSRKGRMRNATNFFVPTASVPLLLSYNRRIRCVRVDEHGVDNAGQALPSWHLFEVTLFAKEQPLPPVNSSIAKAMPIERSSADERHE